MRRIAIALLIGMVVVSAEAMPFPWVRVESLTDKVTSVHSDHVDGSVFLVITESGDILRSLNSGTSWNPTPMDQGKTAVSLWMDPSSSRSWYAVFRSDQQYELWYSMDNADTWEFRHASDTAIQYVSPSPLAGGIVLAAFQQPETHLLHLRKSDNGGFDWIDVLTSEDPGTGPIWHTTSVWQIHWGRSVSYDFGETWRTLSSKAINHCGYDVPPSLLAATPEGLFRSQDNLLTWWPLFSKSVSFVSLNPRNRTQIVAGQSSADANHELYYSDDSGITFDLWIDGLPKAVTDFCLAADWLFLAVSDGYLFKYDERQADIDESGRIDGADLLILATAFGVERDEPGYRERADLNSDGVIDGMDLVILSSLFGHRFYYDESKTPGDFPGQPD